MAWAHVLSAWTLATAELEVVSAESGSRLFSTDSWRELTADIMEVEKYPIVVCPGTYGLSRNVKGRPADTKATKMYIFGRLIQLMPSFTSHDLQVHCIWHELLDELSRNREGRSNLFYLFRETLL